jgi:hypothetical protein
MPNPAISNARVVLSMYMRSLPKEKATALYVDCLRDVAVGLATAMEENVRSEADISDVMLADYVEIARRLFLYFGLERPT